MSSVGWWMKKPATIAPTRNEKAAIASIFALANRCVLSRTASTATFETSPVRWLTEVPSWMKNPAFTAALRKARTQQPITTHFGRSLNIV